MADLADRLSDLPARLEAWRREHRVPGVSLAVLADDQGFATAAGLLNVRTGVEATPDSVFQMGSITKVWTTTLVMQLVDEGKLSLDARVVEVLPGFTLRDPQAARRITVAQLLSHTSGIDGDVFAGAGRGEEAVARYVERLRDTAVLHPPGAFFSYCNAGFVVAGRIVEVLRDRSYDAVLRDHLVEPLALSATGTLPEHAILHRVAAGHHVDAATGAATVLPVWSLQPASAPAGATPFTSAPELLRFARMHLDGGQAPDGTRLLSERSARAMQQRRVTLPPASLADAWGLGWRLHDWQGGLAFGHDGVTLGQRAYLAVVPRTRTALALLSNGGDGISLCRAVYAELLPRLAGVEPPPLPAEDASLPVDPARYVGVYERHGSRITVETQGAGIAVRVQAIWASLAPDPPACALRAVAPDLFRVSFPDSRTDDFVCFLDPLGAGRPGFVMLQGRAHPRTS
jgi:CubicO group peptidase (beta-lactamase class C family)